MKKIKLTENDLINIVKKVVQEQHLLKENIFNCDINSLFKAVSKFTKGSPYSHFKVEIKESDFNSEEKNKSYVNVGYSYKVNDRKILDMGVDDLQQYLKKFSNKMEKIYEREFVGFCARGLKTFGKLKHISVSADVSMVIEEPPKERNGKFKLYRVTSTGKTEIPSSSGDRDINVMEINVSLFMYDK